MAWTKLKTASRKGHADYQQHRCEERRRLL